MADTKAVAKANGVLWIAVNSGAPGKQGAGKEVNAKAKTDWKIENPILLDEAGTAGKAYGARTTPHMFIVKDGKVVYAGAIDNNSSSKTKGEKNYVIQALGEIKEGKAVSEADTRPYGCSVKYK
jgi:phosphatidylserine decarboxylase